MNDNAASFSFWEQQTFIKSPDVVIIGSGIVGLNAALSLKTKNPKLHVIVLERGIFPYGASTRNAGFACYGSPSELLEDLSQHNENDVFSLVEKRWRGLQKLRHILGDNAIEYEPLGGYEVFYPADEQLFNSCTGLLPTLNRNLQNITGEKNIYNIADQKINQFGFKNIQHIIFNSGEGQINTGAMMKVLAEKARNAGVEILNGANVKSFHSNGETTDIQISIDPNSSSHSTISTKRLLIATNGFAKSFLPELDVTPARAQVLITSPIKNLKVKGSFHIDHGFYYFRNVGDRLLLGGGRNLEFQNETTDQFGLNEHIHSRLDQILSSVILPSENFSIEMRWSGIMGLGKEKSPIVKEVSKNIFCAVRMGGMGIAIGSLTGEEAAEMVLQTI